MGTSFGEWITWIWMIAGVLLVASELLHPGLVALFLGVAAILVGGLRFIGVIDGLAVSFLVWSVASVALTLPLRPLVRKYLPAERYYDPSDEDRAAFGQVVDVLEDINPDDASGRIRHQGTTWPATTLEGRIAKGHKAKLVHRDKLAWIVEPALEITDGVDDAKKRS